MTSSEFLALYERALMQHEADIWADILRREQSLWRRVVTSAKSCFYKWFASHDLR